MTEAGHRVRFATDTHLDPDPIHLLRSDDPTIPPEAHVGLLSNHHTYSVDIPVPHSLGPVVSARHAKTNTHFTVTEPPETIERQDGECKYVSTIKLQAKTTQEGSIAEKMEVFVGDVSMEILLTAKVVETTQGTPLLKKGVRVVAHEHTAKTEWPGHEAEHHVSFATDTHLDPDPIHLLRSDDPTIPPEAHVGLLSNHHTYSVDIPVPHSLGPVVSARHAKTNTHFTVTEPPETIERQDGECKYVSIIKLQAKTTQEGNIAEKMEVFVGDVSMEILLTAKVVETTQGTPLLKKGVRVVAHEHTAKTEWPGHEAEHHVSFATDTHLEPDPIHLLRSDDPTIPPEAHVGLLSNHHTYSVDIPVPHSLGPVVSARHAKTNTHFTVTETPETIERQDGECKYVSTIKLQAKTTQEGSIAEKMEVFVGDVSMEILLTAKVVETTQGTPLLKKGVRVVAHEHTAKTEWPGHEAEHHVSFATDTHLDPDPIHLLRSDDPTIPPEAHVGLLSNHHTYSVDIPVPHSLGPVVSAHHTKTNTHFTVTEPPETVEGEDDKFKYVSTIKLQAKTTQEGSIAEKMEVFVGDVTMEILLTAKVVETTQGTPLLKKGVRVVAHEHTAKTEWPGATKPEEHHVSFATDTHLDPEPIRLLKLTEDPSILPEAHVGLLRNHHTYSVDIPVPHSLGPVVSARHAQTNISFTVTEPPETVEGEDDKCKYVSTIKLQVKTTREGSIAEKMEVFVDDGGIGMEIMITAKVIKTNQGTPILKEGVHMISHEHTEESDFTEWPGFPKDKDGQTIED